VISKENQVCLSLSPDPRSTSYSCLRRRVRVCAFHSNISRTWRSPTIPHFHAVRWKVRDLRRRSGRCCGNVDLLVAEAFCDLWGPSSGRTTRRSLRFNRCEKRSLSIRRRGGGRGEDHSKTRLRGCQMAGVPGL